MNLETIAATLMLLGVGVATACDGEKKPATEVEGGKAPAGDAAEKGEMKCGEGKCAAGACGGKKQEGDEAAHADGDAKAGASEQGDAKASGEAKGDAKASGEAKADGVGDGSCGEGSCGAAHGEQKAKDKS